MMGRWLVMVNPRARCVSAVEENVQGTRLLERLYF